MAGLDDLPDNREPVTLDVARRIAVECVELLDVDPDLYLNHGFEEWEARFVAWMEPDSCDCHIDALRYGLEDVSAIEPRGSLILDALKLALSAFILARENPYFDVIEGDRNADIDPVLRRAIDLLRKGRDGGHVQIEYKPETYRNLVQVRRREWLGGLIAGAQGTPDQRPVH